MRILAFHNSFLTRLYVIADIIDLFLHLDKHLGAIIQQYGVWTYSILTLVIFLETGIVVTPFLPGDSLLFAAGALAATGALDVWWLFALLFVADDRWRHRQLSHWLRYWPTSVSRPQSLFQARASGAHAFVL